MPDQHGAWAMLAAPLLVGTLGGGASWLHLLLATTWLVAYLAFHAAGLWLKSRRRRRYSPAARAYTVAVVALGLPLIALDPRLLWWAPVFAPLLAVGLWCAWTRRERSLLNDGATVLAACLMTVVAWQLGTHPYAAPPAAWAWATVLWVYFFGTALYVKTMIRERGNPVMLRLSIGYHALAATVAAALAVGAGFRGQTADAGSSGPTADAGPIADNAALVAVSEPEILGLGAGTWWALAVFFALLTARAWLVPVRFPRATPKRLGIGEIVATTAVVGLFLLS